jgi:hypothetical protein
MTPPVCRLCGTAHWSLSPHRFDKVEARRRPASRPAAEPRSDFEDIDDVPDFIVEAEPAAIPRGAQQIKDHPAPRPQGRNKNLGKPRVILVSDIRASLRALDDTAFLASYNEHLAEAQRRRIRMAPVTEYTAVTTAVTLAATTTCGGCGKEFQAGRSDQIFCSGACRVRAHRRNRGG